MLEQGQCSSVFEPDWRSIQQDDLRLIVVDKIHAAASVAQLKADEPSMGSVDGQSYSYLQVDRLVVIVV